jgi:hypothetical protein
MTGFTSLGVASFLSAAIATPVLAQAVIQEPAATPFTIPTVIWELHPRYLSGEKQLSSVAEKSE